MKAVFFIQKQNHRKRKLMQKAYIRIENHKISFNQEIIRWLKIWLDTELIFKAHFQKHLQKVKKTETRIRALSWRKNLTSDLVLRIQIMTVQATVLYKAELWWHEQKNKAWELQQLINQQAQIITEAFWFILVKSLLRDTELKSAETILQIR